MTTNYAAVGLLETLRDMRRQHEEAAAQHKTATAIAAAYGLAAGYESAAIMVAEALPRIIAEALAGATEIAEAIEVPA